jgi:hypothetical protein
MQTQEITPEVASKQALTVYDQAKAITVIDNESMTFADEMIKNIRLVRKEIEAVFSPIIKKAWEAHKEAKNQQSKAEAPLIAAEEWLRPQVKKYLSDQETIRLLEENRLRLEAQKAEEERRIAEAAQAEAEGRQEDAEAILDTPAPIVMPTVEKTVPKADMRLYRKVWKFRVINPDIIPKEYLTPDLIKIGGIVRALKGQCKISGIEVYEE